MLADHEIDEFFHEGCVPFVVLWIVKVRYQREVKTDTMGQFAFPNTPTIPITLR